MLCDRSRRRLEAEILMLWRQLKILQQGAPRPAANDDFTQEISRPPAAMRACRAVCTENLTPQIMVMEAAMDRVGFD
jgi:hypothetical protein